MQGMPNQGTNIKTEDEHDQNALLLGIQQLQKNGDLLNEVAYEESSKTESLPTIQWLLHNGADIATRDEYGRNSLLLALDNGRDKSVIELLLNNGAIAATEDLYRRTPLLSAIENGRDKGVIELLLNNGADVYARDTDGYPVLHSGIKKGIQRFSSFYSSILCRKIELRGGKFYMPLIKTGGQPFI